MTDPDPARARNRFFLITLARLAGVAGAIFGIVIVGRFDQWPLKALGGAIVLSALYMSWVVPAALAHRWATPGNVRTNRRRPPRERR